MNTEANKTTIKKRNNTIRTIHFLYILIATYSFYYFQFIPYDRTSKEEAYEDDNLDQPGFIFYSSTALLLDHTVAQNTFHLKNVIVLQSYNARV